jgi:uncharacterized membrane protein HdeD (DUF308 family)
MMLSGVISLVLGIVMMLSPDVENNALRFVFGGGLALFGAVEIAVVFAKPKGLLSVGGIIPGVLSLAVGLVFLFRFDTFVILLWIMIGVAMLIDAIYKLQYSFELKTAEVESWWVLLLISLATLIMAAVLMIQPFQEQKSMGIFAGVILAVNGLFDWTVVVFTTVFAKKLIAVKEALKEEGEIDKLPSPKKNENPDEEKGSAAE